MSGDSVRTVREHASGHPQSADKVAARRVVPVQFGGASEVIVSQQTAGNAAVSGWLQQRRPAVQRDRKLPDDATTLGGLSSVAKDLIIDDSTISLSGMAAHFKNPRINALPGLKVNADFGGAMAARADPATEKRLQDGLGTLGMMIFGLAGDPPKSTEAMPSRGKRRPPTADLVHLQNLDLTAFGGQDGRYRFTAAIRKGSAGALTEVDLIVELLGARRPGFKEWKDVGAGQRKKLEDRFQRFGFTRHEVRPEDTDPALPWKDDEFGKVLQAMELIPDEMLQGVPGIAWVRGHQPSAPKGESGSYETQAGLPKGVKPVRKLTLYGESFQSDDSLIKVVAHEIGHAISNKPAETAAGTALAADTTKAGFKTAALVDSPKAITKYGQTDQDESYAEAYAMFIAEPDTLKALRPRIFAWFTRQLADARSKPTGTKPNGTKP